MKYCQNCGVEVSGRDFYNDYTGRKIFVCDKSECSVALEDEERDGYERERQEAHEEVDAQFGYW